MRRLIKSSEMDQWRINGGFIASGRSKFRYNGPDNAAAEKTIREGPQERAIKKIIIVKRLHIIQS